MKTELDHQSLVKIKLEGVHLEDHHHQTGNGHLLPDLLGSDIVPNECDKDHEDQLLQLELSPQHIRSLHLGASQDRKKALALILLMRRRRRKKMDRGQRKRVWVREILKQRQELGEFKLISSLPVHIDIFETYFRLTREQFETLLKKVSPKIEKITTNMRKAIPANERLAICLRYLVTGEPYAIIASYYRVGTATVAKIIPQVCKAIWMSMSGRFMPLPKLSDWEEIAGGFLDKWNMPNCIGALVGTVVVIKKPPMPEIKPKSKASSSIVLLAIVDANFRFRLIEVDTLERSKVEGILPTSLFWKALEEGRLELPQDCYLQGADDLGPMPHVFVADDTFPLKKNILRPFPGKNLSRIQKSVNNRLLGPGSLVKETFKILTSQWKIYRRVIDVCPETAAWIVKSTLVLHNFQRWESSPPEITGYREDVENSGLQSLKKVTEKSASQEALNVRDKFGIHFLSEDKVEEQDYFSMSYE